MTETTETTETTENMKTLRDIILRDIANEYLRQYDMDFAPESIRQLFSELITVEQTMLDQLKQKR